jgi:hypothetical protein
VPGCIYILTRFSYTFVCEFQRPCFQKKILFNEQTDIKMNVIYPNFNKIGTNNVIVTVQNDLIVSPP